ncbi:DUF917 domain-containing protein [Arthrobacter sp. 24S4-2]|uniref:DUF917 domain-containing protein n=1 Tax=Arthrobacter sp. 24S4-2 TaxID=2575374 RepID=UPI0010C791B1|nr:DUF917 domain-containing protein [Arthrobacter sp. 24S4-2]QCO98427.1 DUF917 domain-containing protein [Arthrobacter sp. 24S4-2]
MTRTWIGPDDIEALGIGCAVLGTGGGGDVGSSVLAAQDSIRRYGNVALVRPSDLPADGIVMPMSIIGAPTAGMEILGSGDEPAQLRQEVEKATGRKVVAVMAAEIGGANGVSPVGWASRLGLPLLDADGIGRAFPELQMISMNVAGISPGTLFLTDAIGNVGSLVTVSPEWSERWARAVCIASGANAVMADYLMTPGEAARATVQGTVSQALSLGRIVQNSQDPITELIAELSAVALISGKIVDVDRTTRDGFIRGTITVEGLGNDHGRRIEVQVQNEYLLAIEGPALLASVPDLITIFDTATSMPIATESLRYGQRITVLAWPSDPVWRTAAGLATAGPAAFGYKHSFTPVEEQHADSIR